MREDDELPLLFLDVDGPLVPFGTGSWRGEDGTGDEDEADDGMDACLSVLRPALGRRLASLPCRLVWATAWGQDANTEIAPRIGLPELAVVAWPAPSDERSRVDDWFGVHWKTRALVEWADGRPFAWVDDELTEADRRWVAEHHAGRALLHHVDAARGLAGEDFRVLGAWLASIGNGMSEGSYVAAPQGSSRR